MRLGVTAVALAWAALGPLPLRAQESPAQPLRYRFQRGQVLDFEVSSQVVIEMKVQGKSTTVTNDTNSVRRWKVLDVDAEGAATIQLSTERVHMSSTEGDNTIEFDSSDPAKQPESLQPVNQVVGKPISQVVISPLGKVVKETMLVKPEGIAIAAIGGAAELLVPLPEEPVAVGDTWQHQFKIKLPKSPKAEYSARQTFTLAQIQQDQARIDFKTAILTPIDNAEVEAQLVQRRPAGAVQFDLAQGLIVGRRLSLDETVVGFAGPTSSFQITSKYTERLVNVSLAKNTNEPGRENRQRR